MCQPLLLCRGRGVLRSGPQVSPFPLTACLSCPLSGRQSPPFPGWKGRDCIWCRRGRNWPPQPIPEAESGPQAIGWRKRLPRSASGKRLCSWGPFPQCRGDDEKVGTCLRHFFLCNFSCQKQRAGGGVTVETQRGLRTAMGLLLDLGKFKEIRSEGFPHLHYREEQPISHQ